MKLLSLVLAAFIAPACSYIQFEILSMDLQLDPKFGNTSFNFGSGKTLESFSFWIFQAIPTFIVKSSYFSDTGKAFMNITIKPCDEKSIQRMRTLLKSTFVSSKIYASSIESKIKCPLEAQQFDWPAIEKSFRLPVVVLSFLVTPGKYVMKYAMIATDREKAMTFMIVLMRYEIKHIGE